MDIRIGQAWQATYRCTLTGNEYTDRHVFRILEKCITYDTDEYMWLGIRLNCLNKEGCNDAQAVWFNNNGIGDWQGDAIVKLSELKNNEYAGLEELG